MGWLLLCSFVLVGCKKPPKRKREEIVAESSRERQRIDNFVHALRRVIEWRQTQPVADTEAARHGVIKGVAKKFDQIPLENLPDDVGKPWKRMMKAWKALAKDPKLNEDLIKEGNSAAEELNQVLEKHGYPDVRL